MTRPHKRPADPAGHHGPSPLETRLFAHAHQRRAADAVVGTVTRPGGKQLVAVFGPPRVGKTRLCAIIENALAAHWRAELEADARVVPVAWVEAPAAVGRDYPWRDLLTEVLEAIGEPEAERLVAPAQLTGAPPERMRPARPSPSELQAIVRGRLRRREVRALIIDEAQHLAAAPNPRSLRAMLDAVKSLANKTGTRVVLVGTYELLDFQRASAQLAGRIVEVHFPRYHWTNEHEREAFLAVAREMLETIEGLDEATISASLEIAYERSLGLIGELRDWLLGAEHEWKTSGRAWSACLASTADATGKAAAMLDEIVEAERRHQAGNASRQALRLRLGLPGIAGGSGSSPRTRPVGGPRRRPGRRTPTRDPVGPRGA